MDVLGDVHGFFWDVHDVLGTFFWHHELCVVCFLSLRLALI